VSRLKFSVIRYTLLAYVLLTLWQVLTKREDFPLSSFPMFAREFKGNADRTVLVGVSEHGETSLNPQRISGLMSAPRLQKIFQQLQRKSDTEQADFMGRVASILSTKDDDDDRLWAVRFYTESWHTQPHLKGIEHPTRALEFAAYIPPERLRRTLAQEEKSGVAGEGARPLPRGDSLYELGTSACNQDCSVVADTLASEGHAVRLERGGSLHVTVPAGNFSLFVRVRTQAPGGDDHLSLELDGKKPKEAKDGLGNFKHQLPYDAWVWASLEPGWPALRLKTKRDGSELKLTADRAVLEVDQLWLAGSRTEIPTFNVPLAPSATAGQP
jgi:hypothetical protein